MDQPLLVFKTVVEQGNFTRAAEELHMTQPAVSQYIQALERIVGSKLLERTNKYVKLNKAGEIVYHHAKEILGGYTRMQTLVDDLLHVASGNIAIGASYTFGEYILPHIVAQLRKRFPLIQPTITIGNTREIAELVLSHQLEVGVVEGEYRHAQLIVEPFAEDRMLVIAPGNSRYAEMEDIRETDLSEATWIVREEGSGTREAAEKMFRELGFRPRQFMEFGSTQIIKESVEAGLGLALLSEWTIRKEVALGSLRTLNLQGLPVTRQFSVVTPATRFHTKAVEVFVDLLHHNDLFPMKLA